MSRGKELDIFIFEKIKKMSEDIIEEYGVGINDVHTEAHYKEQYYGIKQGLEVLINRLKEEQET